jgi:hypothetical protein
MGFALRRLKTQQDAIVSITSKQNRRLERALHRRPNLQTKHCTVHTSDEDHKHLDDMNDIRSERVGEHRGQLQCRFGRAVKLERLELELIQLSTTPANDFAFRTISRPRAIATKKNKTKTFAFAPSGSVVVGAGGATNERWS